MIFLADAMVLIDLEYVGGSLLPQMGATEVMDLVLAECIHTSQPAEELCRWLRALPEFGRRLPQTETHRLSRLLGC